MTNYSVGHQAENIAAEYLKNKGYEIVDQNWKTKYCEIDIIAKINNKIHFVEVKYRKSSQQGSGLAYITPKKIKQMSFAAQLWVIENNWSGDYQLSAIEMSGNQYQFINFLPDL